ncbi:MAG TPA: transglycosylase SLT domain-containing protein [Bryobacteraceae bacterium]|nr:transglycosylase SLT domain-containing protein [Bryobacteraceae bacterium]
MRLRFLLLLCLAPLEGAAPGYFVPDHRLPGIGIERDALSDETLALRTDLMIQSQTFAIMRDPQALPGAKRITSDRKLQSLFHLAAERSGMPEQLLEAIAYVESWGDPKAESPTGPRGIMQVSLATAREMGLRIVSITRYRVVKERVQVRDKRKRLVTRTVRRRIPYVVGSRDDRLNPDRVIPAAANYLANLERRFGGRDWAVFAYHCGEGCVATMQDLTRRARGIPPDEITVARMFFSCSPAWNRELYMAVQSQMQRDYSPTYWFRIERAQQLLAMYREDPGAFEDLAKQYKSDFPVGPRAPHRLTVWLKQNDLVFHSSDDIRAAEGTKLVRAFNQPAYFGYLLRLSPDTPDGAAYLSEASPSALGTLMYIAYETRRVWEAMNPNGEIFQPLEVSSLVETDDYAKHANQSEALAHTSGQVFDIAYNNLPSAEQEALRFILDDLGWEGYLGFVDDGPKNIHIGCAPSARDFFAAVFQDAADSKTIYVASEPVAGQE